MPKDKPTYMMGQLAAASDRLNRTCTLTTMASRARAWAWTLKNRDQGFVDSIQTASFMTKSIWRSEVFLQATAMANFLFALPLRLSVFLGAMPLLPIFLRFLVLEAFYFREAGSSLFVIHTAPGCRLRRVRGG